MFFGLEANTITLEPIEIKASKTLKSTLDIPKTIEVLDSEKLNIHNIDSINNLSSSISNTNISGIGGRSEATITMRGISNYTTYESSISVYVDDTPLPFSYGFGALNFRDITKIEVLKGPQGTLYGRSSESGVINIYTPSPSKVFKSEVALGIGEYNSKNMYGVISAPLNDEFSYMVSAYKNSRDGFSTNTYLNQSTDYRNSEGINLKLLYTPTSSLSFAFKYAKDKLNDGGSPFKTDTKHNPYTDNEPYKEYLKMNTDIASLKIKYLHPDYTFTSMSSYTQEDLQNSYYLALNGGIVLDRDIQIQEFTQEFRLNTTITENLDVLLGTFYSNKFQFDYDDTNSLQALPLVRNWNIEFPDESYALFTQLEYWMQDDLSLTAGIRYEKTKREFDRSFVNFNGDTSNAQVSSSWVQILPKIALSYYINNTSHIYLSYAKGYRPGGYNYRSVSANPLPHDEKSTQSFELGYKSNLTNSLLVNSVLFYSLSKNARTNTFADDLSSSVKSAKKAYAYGAELDITYKPNKKLYFFSNLGLTRTKMNDFSGLDTQYNGNEMLDVPDFTASIGAKHTFMENYYVQSDFRYVGQRYYDIANTTKESGYKVFNIGLGFEKGTYKALLYANNVLDETYVDYMIATPNHKHYHFGYARIVGFTLSKSFD